MSRFGKRTFSHSLTNSDSDATDDSNEVLVKKGDSTGDELEDSDENHCVDSVSKRTNSEDVRKRRRRRKRVVTICTTNSRYEVVRRVAYGLGMREVADDDSWNLYWTDLSITVERCKEMKRFQKVNHFPGMSEICRKDLLARNLNRMLKLYPEEYSFFPKSWCLPADMADLVAYSRTKKNKTYILKPEQGCQGRGIIVTKSIRDVRLQEKMICQVYVARPFLVDGYKFDLRLYTLITSCDPLRIFVYNDGLARFATSRYKEPTGGNAGNIYMHLTNYAVNRHNRMFIVDDESGSKRKVSTLNRWLEFKSYNTARMWQAIDDVIVKTVIAAHAMLKHSYHTCFPTHDYTYACFEILGFDVLLDENLKPYILEVNHSPSFHTDTQIDREVKEGLLRDTFQLLNLKQCDKRKIIEEDRKRVRDRLLKGIYKDQNSVDTESNSASPLALQTEWEDTHNGNFRKIYPCEGYEKYDKFFHQNSSSLFQDTAASRAREEASRMQREESLSKARQEAARRAGNRLTLDKLRPESPHSKTSSKSSLRRLREIQLAKSLSNSFEPTNIVEAEEMERLYQMSQREFMLKSCGLIEEIYQHFKTNRVLRLDGEKHNLLSKIKVASFDIHRDKDHRDLFLDKCGGVKQLPKTIEDSKADSMHQESTFSIIKEEKGLCVWSNEAPISIRPVPVAQWPFLPVSNLEPSVLPAIGAVAINQDVRSTKAYVARSYTNNAKLRQLERRQNLLRPT